MKKLIIILTVLLFALTNCDTTDPKPPEEKPPGYQEDIPWPSLADSPWPMNHHDPQNTGRASVSGALIGEVEWEYDEYHDINAGISISDDSTIYAIYGGSSDAGLLSLSSFGIKNWKKELGRLKNYTTPLITSNGSILCTDSYNKVLCIFPDSSIIWEFITHEPIFQSSLNIGIDGKIYFLDNSQNLYCLDPNGNLLWKYFDSSFVNNNVFRTAFSPNGEILYIPGIDKTINAFNVLTQQIEWSYTNNISMASSDPIVDSQGNIYFVDTYGLKSLNSNGQLRWEFTFTDSKLGWETPCIDKNGNITFGIEDSIVSVDYSGNLRWQKSLGDYLDTPPICDKNGNIFVGSAGNKGTIICFNSSGSIIWQLEADTQIYCRPPLIGFNETVIFPFYRNKILKIK